MKLLGQILTATVLALTVSACSGVVDPIGGKRLGVIAFHGDPVVVEVPDTVEAGVPFEVSVRTYGGGCISKNGTDLRVDGLTADVRPYDNHSGHQICTDELRVFVHRATLAFGAAGRAEVRFHGTEKPSGSAIVVARTVIVE